jgi:MFS family permease
MPLRVYTSSNAAHRAGSPAAASRAGNSPRSSFQSHRYVLEGIGAALIMPAIVALVAGNFPAGRRTAAYGMIAAAGAIAVAVGPLIGGAVTTFASWRWVFVGEAVIVIGILTALRKVGDAPPAGRVQFDVIGALLSIAGLSLLVFGVLQSGTWGFVKPKPAGPQLLGTSPVIWLVTSGLLVIYGFFLWEAHVERRGREPLIRPPMLRNRQLAILLNRRRAQAVQWPANGP